MPGACWGFHTFFKPAKNKQLILQPPSQTPSEHLSLFFFLSIFVILDTEDTDSSPLLAAPDRGPPLSAPAVDLPGAGRGDAAGLPGPLPPSTHSLQGLLPSAPLNRPEIFFFLKKIEPELPEMYSKD